MKERVNIDIVSVITADGVSESITEKHEGELLKSPKDGSSYIFYREKTEDGALSDCRIVIDKNTLSLRKTGSATVTMEFEDNKSTRISYNTMYGAFDFLLETRKCLINSEGSEHKACIEYILKSGDTVVSEHNMEIKIRPTV